MRELNINETFCATGASFGSGIMAGALINLTAAGVLGTIGAGIGASTSIGAINGASYAVLLGTIGINSEIVLSLNSEEE